MDKLAIDGGSPVRTKSPITEQDVFEEEELQALMRVAKQKKLRRADAALEYEKAIADWFGVKHAIAVTSGTTTLHIALAAFGVGPGDLHIGHVGALGAFGICGGKCFDPCVRHDAGAPGMVGDGRSDIRGDSIGNLGAWCAACTKADHRRPLCMVMVGRPGAVLSVLCCTTIDPHPYGVSRLGHAGRAGVG